MRTRIHIADAAIGTVFGSALIAAFAVFTPFSAGAEPVLHVTRTAACGCCHAWVERMEEAGFAVEAVNVDQGALVQRKVALGVTPETASCHTAEIDGYVVEGHVPAADIRRLLAERPDARGISVPGMPMGSPGMDFGDESEPYDTVLIHRNGTVETYQSHE